MSKSEENFNENACGCSSLHTLDNNDLSPTPGCSTKKRSKPPDEVNFCNKAKGKYSKSNKRKKSNKFKNLSEMSKKESNLPIVEEDNLLCQKPHTCSALLVPNNNDIMAASTSKNGINVEHPSNSYNSDQNTNANSRKSKKGKSGLKGKPSIETINIGNNARLAEERHRKNRENFEEELRCSICSEIFISAVTLNCSHSFCKYCITQWRKNNDTCPICRQIISSQNSTLVLDKCVERILDTSDEEIKTHRQTLMEYREKHNEETPLTNTPNNYGVSNLMSAEDVWLDSDDSDYEFVLDSEYPEDDLYDVSDPDYFYDEHDYSGVEDVEGYSDDHVEEYLDGDNEHYSEGDEGPEEVNDCEEEEEYGEDCEEEYEESYEYTDEEDTESGVEYEENEDNEGYSDESENNDEDAEDSEYSADMEYGIECFNCGLLGHFARECPTRVAYTGTRGGYYGGYGKCFKCQQAGHWANGCPN